MTVDRGHLSVLGERDRSDEFCIEAPTPQFDLADPLIELDVGQPVQLLEDPVEHSHILDEHTFEHKRLSRHDASPEPLIAGLHRGFCMPVSAAFSRSCPMVETTGCVRDTVGSWSAYRARMRVREISKFLRT